MIFLKSFRFLKSTINEVEYTNFGKLKSNAYMADIIESAMKIAVSKKQEDLKTTFNKVKKFLLARGESKTDIYKSKKVKLAGSKTDVEILQYIEGSVIAFKNVYKNRIQADYFYATKTMFKKRNAIVIVRVMVSDKDKGINKIQQKVLLKKTTKTIQKKIKEII